MSFVLSNLGPMNFRFKKCNFPFQIFIKFGFTSIINFDGFSVSHSICRKSKQTT